MIWKEPKPLLAPAPLRGLHSLVEQELLRKGITSRSAVRAFLDPDEYLPSRPEDLPGMEAAVTRIETAIHSREPICVWGDFDVDGQTSTTLLVQCLNSLGADVTYHIPVRANESHGVNLPELKKAIDRGARLILTCDTGITAHEAAEYARNRKVDLIITDHHDFPENLPEAAAVINPKFLPSGHALASLSGVGVAYKLAEQLLANSPSSTCNSDSLLDLVALGLVADLAILKNDVRYLVQKGLTVLRKTERLGLKVMMEMAELVPTRLSEEHIGFMLAPRLNALGRLGDANPAVELLTTKEPERARLLAAQLENYNIQRQLLCNQVVQAAEARLREDPSLLSKPVIILDHPTWPAGVVGIVASRLVERYHKPAIILSTPANEPGRGSARSVEGLNITSAIAAQKDLLLNFGGHPMAAGLSLDKDNLPDFSRRLFRTVEAMLGATSLPDPELRIDAWMDISGITTDLAGELETLAPFGPGNEKLILATRGLSLRSATLIGRNKEHQRLIVSDESGISQTVLWWGGAGEPIPQGKFDLAYTVRASDWRGNQEVQMEFVDFRVIENPVIEIKSPPRTIIDSRNVSDPLSLLPEIHAQPSTLVWAEAEAKKDTGGKDRNELESANHLVIWTTPPSQKELDFALDIVKPGIITLVCAHPLQKSVDGYLTRLAGLLKFTITHKAGKVTYAELAAATAERVITVELGLNWLISSGKIILVHQVEDQLWVTPGKTVNDLGGAARLKVDIQELLEETAAYRVFFHQVDKKTLFP